MKLPPTRAPAGLTRGIAIACAALLAMDAAPAGASDDYLDPQTGFRMSHYQAVVPETVAGGTRITTEQAEQIFKDRSAAFIDVSPSIGAGFDPQTGRWRLRQKHGHIPGSTWLPDVGRGAPGEVLISYFANSLEVITGGDKSRPILIYCKADCWMGWNAVKRAAGLGYTNIYWYPDGIDGWTDWDNPVAVADPVPVKIGELTR